MRNHCLRLNDPTNKSTKRTDDDQVIVWVDLPDDVELVDYWDPPLPSPAFPWDTTEVEHLVDGVLVARGVWPNLEPVKARKSRAAK